jgi:DNA-binding NtrC family response regulator
VVTNDLRALETLIIGESLPVRQLRSLIAKVAPARVPVLIQGPTGSGKELVAQALHLASGRQGRFVPFNVCAIAETMFEDALFGHARGAFTGATSDMPGYLAEADRGTAFLDEISGLALAAQAKLLRAIETGEYRPVGARGDRRSDFRLVAASNEDIGLLVDDGRFRADLAHRLRAFVVRVPPLAVRLEDVPSLAHHFLRASGLGDVTALDDGALEALRAYPWPGNVRELRHVIERAAIIAGTSTVGASAVRLALEQTAPPLGARTPRAEKDRHLLEVLELVGWDVNEAARLLGAHRATVYRRLKRMGDSGRRATARGVISLVREGDAQRAYAALVSSPASALVRASRSVAVACDGRATRRDATLSPRA